MKSCNPAAIRRGDNCNALRNNRQFELLVHVENAVFLKFPDYFAALTSHIAHGIHRIDVAYIQTQPLRGIPLLPVPEF